MSTIRKKLVIETEFYLHKYIEWYDIYLFNGKGS